MALRFADFVKPLREAIEKREKTLAPPFDMSFSLVCLEPFDWTAMDVGRAANLHSYSYSKPPGRQLQCLGLAAETCEATVRESNRTVLEYLVYHLPFGPNPFSCYLPSNLYQHPNRALVSQPRARSITLVAHDMSNYSSF